MMTQPNLLQVGNRIVNLGGITHILYELDATHPSRPSEHFSQLTISFACDDFQTFYGGQADVLWHALRGRSTSLGRWHEQDSIIAAFTRDANPLTAEDLQ